MNGEVYDFEMFENETNEYILQTCDWHAESTHKHAKADCKNYPTCPRHATGESREQHAIAHPGCPDLPHRYKSQDSTRGVKNGRGRGGGRGSFHISNQNGRDKGKRPQPNFSPKKSTDFKKPQTPEEKAKELWKRMSAASNTVNQLGASFRSTCKQLGFDPTSFGKKDRDQDDNESS